MASIKSSNFWKIKTILLISVPNKITLKKIARGDIHRIVIVLVGDSLVDQNLEFWSQK